MAEIELTHQDQKVQKLIDYFDLNLERNLDFDSVICFHGPDQNYREEKKLKDLLDELIQNESRWDRISVSCRRMIICDRELDLEEGLKILAESLPLFESLLTLTDDQLTHPKKVAQNIVNNHKNQIYEIIRYVNTCGLISYRSGDYSKALNFFELAECIARNPYSFSLYFVPDITSNSIRTKFEFFSQVLPDQIPDDRVSVYGKNLIDFIASYYKEIEYWKDRNFEEYWKDSNFEHNGDIVNWIYGHGMASLYHNLAEAYHFAFKKCGNDSLLAKAIFKEYAVKANKTSLNDYGAKNKYKDIYRQLQSKNALSRLGYNSDDYEKDILGGRWKRGKAMVCQDKIKNMKGSDKNKIKEKVKKWTENEYFTLDLEDNDKIGLLYNYDSIKKFMVENDFQEITVQNNNFSLMKIAFNKIKIADEMRSIFSPLLYKRQVMRLIRDDISFITDNFLNGGKFDTALNFSERYSNRGLAELLDFNINKNSGELKEKIEEINELKRKINSSIDAKIKQNDDCPKVLETSLSIVLDTETDENYLKLVFAYENILKSTFFVKNNITAVDAEEKSPRCFVEDIDCEDLYNPLLKKLKTIPKEENTVVIKFLVTSFKSYNKEEIKITPTTIWALLIDRNDVRKLAQINSPNDLNYSEFISKVQKGMDKFAGTVSLNTDFSIHENMGKMAEYVKIYEELDDVTNIFIVPDGELFQLPLHLLEEEGQDLRRERCVYYSPSLRYLLNKQVDGSLNKLNINKYLWICSPTKDLFTTKQKPCLKKPELKPELDPENIKFLECSEATLKKFNEVYGKYTHIGFSTHASFHNNLVTSYVSLVNFYDSFLTTYDILLLMDFTNIETIFLGACSGAMTKYTDENESVGLVTAFLLKGVSSVIAPICKISGYLHDELIDQINKNSRGCASEDWSLDLSNIYKGKLSSDRMNKFVPFVQYSDLRIIENR